MQIVKNTTILYEPKHYYSFRSIKYYVTLFAKLTKNLINNKPLHIKYYMIFIHIILKVCGCGAIYMCSCQKNISSRQDTKKGLQSRLTLKTSSKRRQPPTLPHCIAVPSAQTGLTSLFGMGRGGTPPQ